MYKEDGQEYAQVIRMLGNGRLESQCIDGKKRLCHIRGKMRKKVWVAQVRGGRAAQEARVRQRLQHLSASTPDSAP